MIQIGKKAPVFTAKAIVDKQIQTLSLDDFAEKYKLLFFYPLDFTFVCPTEILAIQEKLAKFKKQNVEVLGISIDSVHSHLAWINTPRASGGVEGISFPLVSDINKTIARDYGVLDDESGVALRGVFLLDKSNIVQHCAIHNLSLGRNIEEIIRVIDALQYVEKHGEVCPANWIPGAKAIKPTKDGLKKYFCGE